MICVCQKPRMILCVFPTIYCEHFGFQKRPFFSTSTIYFFIFRGIIFRENSWLRKLCIINSLIFSVGYKIFFMKKRKIYAHVTHIFYMYIWMEILISPKNLYLLFLLNLYIWYYNLQFVTNQRQKNNVTY